MVQRTLAGIVAVIAAVVFAGAALAEPFEEGALAYQRGDYPAALALWAPLAGGGHERAGFRLALMYDSGIGVTRDNAEAAKWFRRSAAQGAADAQFYVGLI